MPWNRKLYPDNWDAISSAIKADVGWRCEECGKDCKRPDEDWMEFCDRVRTARLSECRLVAEILEKPGRFVLTVAHLDHRPENCDRRNLKALCAPCHCRYDLAAMATKKRLKAERLGQLQLDV